ncbi:MAG: tetratricopeptide repeat protein, partial [Brevundimonas sp.]
EAPPAVLPAEPTPAPAAVPETPATEEEDGGPANGGPALETPEEPAEPAIPAVWAPVPRDAQGDSAYGLYLAGRVALAGGVGDDGARLLARAQALTPEQPSVTEQAFIAALMSGDMDVAGRTAPTDAGAAPLFVETGKLVRAVQAFATGDARGAYAQLKQPIGAPHTGVVLLLKPWVAAAAGDWRAAQAEPDAGLDAVSLAFARANRALLLEMRGRTAEAETEFKALADQPGAGALFKVPYGEFLERRGRRAEAQAVYEAAIAGGQNDVPTNQALRRVRDGGAAPAAPTLKTGAALALTTAAAQASVARSNEVAVVYLRLALNLDRDPEVLYRLGQTLSRAGLSGPAQQVLEQITPRDTLLYAAARLQLGLAAEAAKDNETALARLREAAAAAPEDAVVARVLAGQLLSMKRYDETLAVLDGPLLNTADQNPDVRFMRGAAYEALGRIDDAEAELWAALQAEPNSASVQNYLGYLWVDHNLRVAQGAELIARAHASQPDDGNIQDSLGWAQYRQGQYEQAVETLEGAVAKLPANPEINDHLGDAYWRVGRQREAGFQWRRVLSLDPDAEQRAAAERKLAEGLTEAPAGGAQP